MDIECVLLIKWKIASSADMFGMFLESNIQADFPKYLFGVIY